MPQTEAQKNQSTYNVEANKNYFLKTKIKGLDVEPYGQVFKLIVREWIFDVLPRVEMELLDGGRFTEQYPLEDLDEIEIELNNIKSNDPVVKATFQLNDYEIKYTGLDTGNSEQTIINLTGFLKNTNIFFPIHNRAFSRKNSNDVLSQIVSENEDLKFVSRIKPKDNMNWIQSNQTNAQFINHILEHSYLRRDDIQFFYTDRNSNSVYTSLNTEIDRNVKIKNYVYNPNANLLTSSNLTQQELDRRLEIEKEESPNTNYFFNYQYKNIAGTNTKKGSYGTSYNYFDIQKKESNIFNKIVTDIKKLTKNSLKNKDNVGKIVSHINHGFIDSSNVHLNYIEACVQNEYLKNEFFSSYLILYTRPDNTVNLFDVIDVKIPSNLKIDDNVNDIYSGKYIVGGILHHVENKKLFDDILILFRNGLNVSGFIKEGNATNS